jgi:hypothetical protein
VLRVTTSAALEASSRRAVAHALQRRGIMNMMNKTIASAEPVTLCYLDNTQIEGPLQQFDGVEVRNRGDRKIGKLDGIVIDPTERRVRYLVVNDSNFLRHHRYLLPLGATRVDAERRALCVEVDQTDVARCEEFDLNAFRTFSFRPR